MSNPDGMLAMDPGHENPEFMMQEVDESQLEERPEVHFKNGATYVG